MFTNKLKHDLYAGKTCFGTFMCLNSTDVVEIGGLAGFDFVHASGARRSGGRHHPHHPGHLQR